MNIKHECIFINCTNQQILNVKAFQWLVAKLCSCVASFSAENQRAARRMLLGFFLLIKILNVYRVNGSSLIIKNTGYIKQFVDWNNNAPSVFNVKEMLIFLFSVSCCWFCLNSWYTLPWQMLLNSISLDVSPHFVISVS